GRLGDGSGLASRLLPIPTPLQDLSLLQAGGVSRQLHHPHGRLHDLLGDEGGLASRLLPSAPFLQCLGHQLRAVSAHSRLRHPLGLSGLLPLLLGARSLLDWLGWPSTPPSLPSDPSS